MLHDDIARLRLRAQGISHPLAGTPEDVVTRLGAVQAQDYPGALWSIGLRTRSGTRDSVEQAIADRTIVRTWPMRGTLHFVPAADANWMLELMTPRIMQGAEGRHRRLELDAAAFTRSRALIGKALAREPVMTRSALFAALDAGGVATTGQRGIHVLQRLCMERMLCYGPHAGKHPTFVMFDDWIGRSRMLDRDDALRVLAERYFTGHGPATLRDFIWWTGLRVADARLALHLAQPSLEKFETQQGEYWKGKARVSSTSQEPRAHLLPGFDEFMLGYRDRSAALAPQHANRIVPGGNGMFLSTLVLDARVRGTWRRAARANGVSIDAIPFTTLKVAERKPFAVPAERYAGFLRSPVFLGWSKLAGRSTARSGTPAAGS